MNTANLNKLLSQYKKIDLDFFGSQRKGAA